MKSTKAMNANTRITAQEVQDAAKEIKDQAVAGAENTFDVARSQLRDIARNTGAKVHDFFSEKREQLGDAKVTAEETIRANPFTTAAAAFAAGALFVTLFKRR